MLFLFFCFFCFFSVCFFFFNDTATTEIYTLSLHDALPIFGVHVLPSDLSSNLTIPQESTETGVPSSEKLQQ